MIKRFVALLITTIIFIPPSLAQHDPYYPVRIMETITLDGKLNEPAWQLAPVEDDFMQTDPNPGALPTEKTEVRILYSNEYLFVGIRSFDSDPSSLIRLRLERDFNLGEDDGTAVIIDTYHDRTTGLVFVSNTLNARWDAQVSSDGNDENDSYNTFWDAVTHIDSTGYTTEYRIPFSSLRFEARDTVLMAFRISRLIKRKNELITFPRCHSTTSNLWENISCARDIVFTRLKSRRPFYISPYAIANYSEEYVLSKDGSHYERQSEFLVRKHFAENAVLDKIISNIGVDAKYGLSKNFTLDLTLNTDFAQAEVDDRIINLSKYEVNLPEKRSFFLESANNLSFSFSSGAELFISRSIGNENGEIVPIIGGARVTGKSKGWQLGILDMQTRSVNNAEVFPHNFFVFRTRRDIDSLGSFVGGIVTSRINTDSSHHSNQSIGLDVVKRLNQQVSIEGGIASSLTDFNLKPIAQSLYYGGGIFKNASHGLTYGASVNAASKDFYPVMGYLDENNYVLLSLRLGYELPAAEQSSVEYWYVFSHGDYRWRLNSGARETFATNLFPGVQFKNGAIIEFSPFDYVIDSLTYDWHLNGSNAIATGTYKMFTNRLNLTSPQKSVYSANLYSSFGDFYGGKRFFLSPDIRYSFGKHLNLGLTYEFNYITFHKYLEQPRNTVFESHLIRLRIAYIFSTKVSLKLYAQYDNISHSISSNLRFRYNPTEGTDLYIVINQGLNTERTRLDPHLPLEDNQEVTVKFVRTFGL